MNDQVEDLGDQVEGENIGSPGGSANFEDTVSQSLFNFFSRCGYGLNH